MEQAKGHLAIFVSCIIFATNIVVTSSLTSEWMTPMGYTLSRLVYGAIALWVAGLFLKKEKVGCKDICILALGGFLGFIVSQLAFATSVQYTSAVNFSLIMAMVPIVVLLIALVTAKEKLSLQKVLGIFLSIAGAYVIILQRGGAGVSGSSDLLGIFIAAGSMSSYAVYLTLTKGVTQKYSSITILKWMFLLSAVMLLPFGFSELVSQKIYTSDDVTATAIYQLLFVFIFDTTIVYFLLLAALHRLKATTVSTYLNLLPVFTSIIAIASGQEGFALSKLVAIVLVVGGLFFVTRSK